MAEDTKTPKCHICGEPMQQLEFGGWRCEDCDAKGFTGIAKRGKLVVFKKGLPRGGG